MTKRTIYILTIMALFLFTGSMFIQGKPTVEVTLSQNSARRDTVVMANVYVHSTLEIIGADVEITADDTCLQIEERVVGDYFPTEEGDSVIIFEETTDNSVRLAMNVLNFDRIPTSDGLFYSVPLRVTCDKADAQVDITFAHLVQRGIIDYKAADGQLNVIDAHLEISPDAPDAVQSADNAAEPAEPMNLDDAAAAETDSEQTVEGSSSIDTVLIVALIVLALIGLSSILLFGMYLRSRKKAA